MAEAPRIENITAVLAERGWPTITLWNQPVAALHTCRSQVIKTSGP